MTRLHLTFLRPGCSLADGENVHEGRSDSPLTEVGRAQVVALAEYWTRYPAGFNAVFCSTLRRAHQTARTIKDALKLPLTSTDLLCEWDNSPSASLDREEALRRYSIPAFRHDLDPDTPESGESQAAIRARALTMLKLLWSAPAGSLTRWLSEQPVARADRQYARLARVY